MNDTRRVSLTGAVILLGLSLAGWGSFVQVLPGPADVPLPLIIGGVALAPIIVALIEMLKALGVPVKYAPWINGLLSLVGYGAVMFLTLKPEYTSVAMWVLGGLIVFLTAAGFYDRAKATVRLVQRR